MTHHTDYWMLTASGAEYHLGGARALMPDNAPRIDDIAHALAQINRFNGHTTRPYSVAEHSLLVADVAAWRGASAVVELAALLHDAHEAYVGDMPSPTKWLMGGVWVSLEAPHIAQVRATFNIKTASAAARYEIKRCDIIALATERRDLTAFNPATHRPWAILDTPGMLIEPSAEHNLNAPCRAAMAWSEWRDQFLERFFSLRDSVAAQTQGAAA